MNIGPVRVERRGSQRFDFQLPVRLRRSGGHPDCKGVTQDLSGRGMRINIDCFPECGDAVEMILVMPAEITLAESMPVCCKGKVVRVTAGMPGKSEVAIQIERYEFLPQQERATEGSRAVGLHASVR